ncbi:hypothetical protein CRE_14596 [Caenorhabditis remanei]|uniref:C2H2-type domain-containing protein n=1 Tax=Caenorhabditis remanei TaxID=31234 RepID=E3M9R8_CAERE|nr:hypothetical protein CRE_14596 [Caenorhabditis remanei]
MSGDQFKCQICRQSFDNAALREEHQRSRHKKSYRCDECGKRFPKPSKATAHINTPHKSKANWIEEFNCNVCGESRTSLTALQEHFKKRHFNNKNSPEFLNAWTACSGEKTPKKATYGGKKRTRGRPLKYRGDGKPRGRGRPPKYATVNRQSVEEETNGDNIGDDDDGEHEMEANETLEDVRRDDDLHEADPTDLPLHEESENHVRIPDGHLLDHDAGEEDVVNLNRSPVNAPLHVVLHEPVPHSLEAVLPKKPIVQQPTCAGKPRGRGRPPKNRCSGKPRGRGRPPKNPAVDQRGVDDQVKDAENQNGIQDNIGDDDDGEHEMEGNERAAVVRRDDDLHQAHPTNLPLHEESEYRVRVPDGLLLDHDAGEEDVVNLNRSPVNSPVHVVLHEPALQSLEAVLPKNPAVQQPNCAGKPRGRGRPPKNRCSGKPRGRGRPPKNPAVDQRRVDDQVEDEENQNGVQGDIGDDDDDEHEMEGNERAAVVRRDDDLHQAHPTNLPLHEESENRVRVPDGLLLDHDAGEEDVVNLNRSPVNSPARQPENHEASLEIGNGAHNEVALEPEFDEIIGGDDYGDKEDNINLDNLQAIPSPEGTDSDVHPNPAPQLGFSEATSSHFEPPVIAERGRSRPWTRGSDDRQRVHRVREAVRFRYLSPEHTPISDENRGSKNRGSESHGWNDRVYNNEQSSSEAGSVRHTNRNRETEEARDRTRFTYPRLRQDELSSPDASPDRSTYRDERESRASESTGTAYHRVYDNESRSSSGSYRDSRIFQSRDRSLSTYRCGYENAQRSSGRLLTRDSNRDGQTHQYFARSRSPYRRENENEPGSSGRYDKRRDSRTHQAFDRSRPSYRRGYESGQRSRDPYQNGPPHQSRHRSRSTDRPGLYDTLPDSRTHRASDSTRDQRSHGIRPDRANNTYRLGYENEPSSSRSYDVSISDRSTNRRRDHRDDPSSFEPSLPKRSRIAGPPVITLEDDSDDDIKCLDGSAPYFSRAGRIDVKRAMFNSIATEKSDSRMPRNYKNAQRQEARQKKRSAERAELIAAHKIFVEQRMGVNDRIVWSSTETIYCLESTICNMLYLDTRHNKIFQSVRDPTGLKELLEKSTHERWPSVQETFEKLMAKLEPLVSLEPIRFFEKRKIECRRGHELSKENGQLKEPGQVQCYSLVKPHCSATFEQIFGLRFMPTLYSPFCSQCLEEVFKKTVITPYDRYHVMLIDGSKNFKIQELTSESIVEMYGSRWRVVSFVECLPHQMEKDKDGYFVAWTRNETGEGWTSKKERFVEKMEKQKIVFRDHNVKAMVFEKIE